MLKRHLFTNVKFCSACFSATFALITNGLMTELDEFWLLERWLFILTNSCLVVMQIHDVSRFKNMYIGYQGSDSLDIYPRSLGLGLGLRLA